MTREKVMVIIMEILQRINPDNDYRISSRIQTEIRPVKDTFIRRQVYKNTSSLIETDKNNRSVMIIEDTYDYFYEDKYDENCKIEKRFLNNGELSETALKELLGKWSFDLEFMHDLYHTIVELCVKPNDFSNKNIENVINIISKKYGKQETPGDQRIREK